MAFANVFSDHKRYVAEKVAKRRAVLECCDSVQVAVSAGDAEQVERALQELSKLTGRPRHAQAPRRQ